MSVAELEVRLWTAYVQQGRNNILSLVQMKEAREIYVPQLAQSLAHIICRSDNEEFKNASFMVLSMEREPKWTVAPRASRPTPRNIQSSCAIDQMENVTQPREQ